ncbi:MAG: helix-turn-helix domain-containing protein [Burkholderiales bacterium]|nr:helix-turn-helix domain-containing protein [Opitutaceae bacterium]
MSFTDQIAKLEKAKADIAVAEAKLASDRVTALAKLPSDYGFTDLNAFLKAVKDAYGKGGKSSKGKPGRKAKGAAKAAKAPKAPKAAKGKRAKITDEIKAQVKALAESGKTGQEIAKALGISAPSVQNIKKAFGMVKARGTAEVAPAAAAPAVEVV